MEKDMDRARELAAGMGLKGAKDEHVRQLARSISSARELSQGLPKDLHWSEESALVFRLPKSGRAAP